VIFFGRFRLNVNMVDGYRAAGMQLLNDGEPDVACIFGKLSFTTKAQYLLQSHKDDKVE